MHTNKISPKRPHAGRPAGLWLRRWRWLAGASLAACLAAAYPAAAAALGGTATSAGTALVNCGPGPRPPCHSPHAYERAYGVAPLLRRGITGRGETVAIFALAQTPASPDIRKDLAAFDTKFGLPRAKLHVVTAIAKSPTPYLSNVEELGDTEMVHAFAPGATLDIILVPADTISSPANVAAAITKAVRESAALHVAVLSISFSGGEHAFTRGEAAAMHAALQQARDQHVTVLGSSGDVGAISSHEGPPVQVNLPASDPLVLGVGGTILDARPDGAYLGEMAWNDNTEAEASGGGYSSLFPRPPYQHGLARARATRGVPDVSANADPSTAMATDNSYRQVRADPGTSSSTPLWAGVIALADQQAGHPLGFVNPVIYRIGRSRAFHDVVTGDNSVPWPTGVFVGYNAGPGWDRSPAGAAPTPSIWYHCWPTQPAPRLTAVPRAHGPVLAGGAVRVEVIWSAVIVSFSEHPLA